MLTPVDIQNKTFKGGIGFDKKEVEMFMSQLATDYETLYRSNVELNDKVTTLTESLQHYRATEDSMQKALTISEKTAEETINAANDKARQINNEATAKAEAIITKANQDLLDTKNEIDRLQKLYERFRAQYLNVLEQQMKLVNHEIEEIDLGPDFESSYTGAAPSAGQGDGNTLGSGLGGGAYAGSNGDDRFEQTNQSPTINHTSLGMDPFADAANGGGRFSRQTGKGFVSNKSGSKKQADAGEKTGLNIKGDADKSKTRVKKNFTSKKAAEAPVTPAPATPAPEAKPKQEQPKETPIPEAAATTAPQQNIQDVQPEPVNAANATDDAYSGEVETKVNKSSMIDSEDNYSEGFDFIVGEDDVENDIPTILPQEEEVHDGDVFVGDVEDNNAQSNLIGNDDDDDEGFKFM